MLPPGPEYTQAGLERRDRPEVKFRRGPVVWIGACRGLEAQWLRAADWGANTGKATRSPAVASRVAG